MNMAPLPISRNVGATKIKGFTLVPIAHDALLAITVLFLKNCECDTYTVGADALYGQVNII